MAALLIAQEDRQSRTEISTMLQEGGFPVLVVDSVGDVIRDIRQKEARVILLGGELNELSAADLIPLLRKFNRHLVFILVATESSLALVRKCREAGIFYHLLPPVDVEELKVAVQCALLSGESRVQLSPVF